MLDALDSMNLSSQGLLGGKAICACTFNVMFGDCYRGGMDIRFALRQCKKPKSQISGPLRPKLYADIGKTSPSAVTYDHRLRRIGHPVRSTMQRASNRPPKPS